MNAAALSETFRDEAFDLLSRIEEGLMALEKGTADGDTIHRIFRSLHTLKGSGAMFGFTEVSAFAHEFESLFDRIRRGELSVDRPVIDLTLKACDHLRTGLTPGKGLDGIATAALVESLRAVDLKEVTAVSGTAPARMEAPGEKTFFIHFRPSPGLFQRGGNPLAVLDELEAMGDLARLGIPDAGSLEAMDPEACRTQWVLLLTTERTTDTIRDAFLFVAEPEEVTVVEIPGRKSREDLLQISFTAKGPLTAEQWLTALGARRPPEATEAKVEGDPKGNPPQSALRSFLKVPGEKVDTLVNLVGEMVTLHSRFHQTATASGNREFATLTEALHRLTHELRETSMGMRMIPIEDLFRSFQRMVRDLSHDLGKEVELVVEGADTELDKNVLDALKDPLLHLLRNAVDHGIETPDVRRAAGKTPAGSLTLKAEYEGGQVLITVADDGKGLDPERLKAKALEKGLIAREENLSDDEARNLIFRPGFSTADRTTEVSGRGVGMDVVKRNVEKLRGRVDLSSEQGKGTRISLRLPLTLAIIDGLLARVGKDYYIVNLGAVKECVDLTPDLLATGRGNQVMDLRGHMVPYISLRERFGIEGTPPAVERMMITQGETGPLGVVVDDVLGQHQTVIKPMGAGFRHLEDLAGATSLGDGTVALVLDVNALGRKMTASLP